MNSENPQKKPPKSGAEKKKEKKENEDKKWRATVGQEEKYTKAHLTLNVSRGFYPHFILEIRNVLLDDDFVFEKLGDGNEYLIVRLELSPAEEDGVLTFWRVDDVYVMVVGVVNHGFYYMEDKRIVKDARPLRGVSYDLLMGKKGIKVGLEALEKAVKKLLDGIRSHNEQNIKGWGEFIGTILVFLPEAVRNNFVLFNTSVKTFKNDNLWGPCGTLVNSWQNCSNLLYEHDPEEGFVLCRRDWALVNEFVRRDLFINIGRKVDQQMLDEIKLKLERKLIKRLKCNTKVLAYMLPIPCGYRWAKKLWVPIKRALSAHRSGMTLANIETHLKDVTSNYTVLTGQLKHVLWGLKRKRQIDLDPETKLYTLPLKGNDMQASISRASTSSGNAKQDIVLVLIGPGRAKTKVADTLRVYGSYFETHNKRFTILERLEMKELPNLICLADIAVLVIDSFVDDDISAETYVLMARAFKTRLLVAIDGCFSNHRCSRDSFKDARRKLDMLLARKEMGGIKFLPIDGQHNGNISRRVNPLFCEWFGGECLFEALELIEVVRDKNLPLRMPLLCIKDKGQVEGKIECGNISAGDTLTIMPAGVEATVTSISSGGKQVSTAVAGQMIEVKLEKIKGLITPGSILCSGQPTRKVRQFRARMWIEQNSIIHDRFTLRMHSVAEKVKVVGGVQQLDTSGAIKADADTLVKHRWVECRLEVDQEIYIEVFDDFQQFGKFVVMNEEGELIAVARVLQLLN